MFEQFNRNQKIAGISLAALLVLVIAVVGYLKSVDFNEYKPQILQAV